MVVIYYIIQGDIKNMKKIFNGYIITYIIDIVLTFICMILLIFYYFSMSIGWQSSGRLVGIFQFDLAQIWLMIFLIIMLTFCLIALFIYLFIAVKQSRKKQLKKSAKLGVVIIPAIFCILLPVVTGISVAITPSETLENEWLCSDARFGEWENENPTNSVYEYYSQKNVFGKVIDLDHSVYLNSKNNELMIIEYQCSFRKSNNPSIFSKFSKRKPYTDEEFYKIIEDNDEYTLYYYSEENFHSYYLVMGSNNSYLFSCYTVININDFSNYSVDNFIADALYNYNCWNEE